MALSAPTPLFERLVAVWRSLELRSDTDDIIRELLGQFSLEKVYASSADTDAFLQLVTALVVKLEAIFYIQRLTLPTDNAQASRYLGLLASWEVTVRTVDFVLHTLLDGRHLLVEPHLLLHRYVPSFLLLALRVLALHPRQPAGQRGTRERRERFARIHTAVEQVAGRSSSSASATLQVCKELTARLCASDPAASGLPHGLKYGLPSLAADMTPLPECLSPAYISELALPGEAGVSWLAQFLALRDVAYFVVGASIQHAVHKRTPEPLLRVAAEGSRDAVLAAVGNLRLPLDLTKADILSLFGDAFRAIVLDEGMPHWDVSASSADEGELDALENLATRLDERQTVHRASDQELVHSISQVWTSIQVQDGLPSKSPPAWPTLYAVNCPDAHLVGGTQLRDSGVRVPEGVSEPGLRLPQPSPCPVCDRSVTLVREVTAVRETWRTLRSLEPETDSINVERHLPSQFVMSHARPDPNSYFGRHAAQHENRPFYGDEKQPRLPPTPNEYGGQTGAVALLPPPSPHARQLAPSPPSSHSGPGSLKSLAPVQTTHVQRPIEFDPAVCSPQAVEPFLTFPPQPPTPATESATMQPQPSPQLPLDRRRPSSPTGPSGTALPADAAPLAPWQTSTAISLPESQIAKPKTTSWNLKAKFTGRRKPSVSAATADSSSLSELGAESQRLEEINLSGLLGGLGGKGAKSKAGRTIKTVLSPHYNSTLALFWSPSVLYVCDAAESPPALKKSITTDSTCIMATVGLQYLAYIVGTRDAKLTLHIVDLAQPRHTGIEYRIPSTQWCRSMAIDQQESHVVVGFDQSVVRWFRTGEPGQVREDRLHPRHKDCKACPPVDTLSFSHDGLSLVAGTRLPRTGVIQVYRWRWPFSSVQELKSCQYAVPLHESEDNGLSSVLCLPSSDADADLVCITTWTQSGGPLLVQPADGHKYEIRSDMSGKHANKLGSRIQGAAFSQSGRQLVLVNEKGHVYEVSSLHRHPMDVKRIATSKELTAKSEAFSLSLMALPDDEYVVLAWADASKMTGWVKKVPVSYQNTTGLSIPTAYPGSPTTPEPRTVAEVEVAELDHVVSPVELPATQSVWGGALALSGTQPSPTPFEGKG